MTKKEKRGPPLDTAPKVVTTDQVRWHTGTSETFTDTVYHMDLPDQETSL